MSEPTKLKIETYLIDGKIGPIDPDDMTKIRTFVAEHTSITRPWIYARQLDEDGTSFVELSPPFGPKHDKVRINTPISTEDT
jgi:hypothetical protein